MIHRTLSSPYSRSSSRRTRGALVPLVRLVTAAALSLMVIALPAHSEGNASAASNDSAIPSLKGKRIGITAIGTDHYWDLKAYQARSTR